MFVISSGVSLSVSSSQFIVEGELNLVCQTCDAAEHFEDRTDVQCLHRWQKVLNPELVKGPWTPEVSPVDLPVPWPDVGISPGWSCTGGSADVILVLDA